MATTATDAHLAAVLPWMALETWGYSLEDLERIRSWDAQANRVLLDRGRMVAFLSTFTYGTVGWVGNVITDPARRGSGLGRAILAEGVRYLQHSRGVRQVALYAYGHTRTFYERQGWAAQGPVRVFCGTLRSPPTPPKDLQVGPLDAADLAAASALDRRAFGADRALVLADLHARPTSRCALVRDHAGRLAGVGFIRDDGAELLLGPVVSTDEGSARALLAYLCAPFCGARALAISPLSNRTSADQLAELGLLPVDAIHLMTLQGALPWQPRYLTAAGAPEKG